MNLSYHINLASIVFFVFLSTSVYYLDNFINVLSNFVENA